MGQKSSKEKMVEKINMVNVPYKPTSKSLNIEICKKTIDGKETTVFETGGFDKKLQFTSMDGLMKALPGQIKKCMKDIGCGSEETEED